MMLSSDEQGNMETLLVIEQEKLDRMVKNAFIRLREEWGRVPAIIQGQRKSKMPLYWGDAMSGYRKTWCSFWSLLENTDTSTWSTLKKMLQKELLEVDDFWKSASSGRMGTPLLVLSDIYANMGEIFGRLGDWWDLPIKDDTESFVNKWHEVFSYEEEVPGSGRFSSIGLEEEEPAGVDMGLFPGMVSVNGGDDQLVIFQSITTEEHPAYNLISRKKVVEDGLSINETLGTVKVNLSPSSLGFPEELEGCSMDRARKRVECRVVDSISEELGCDVPDTDMLLFVGECSWISVGVLPGENGVSGAQLKEGGAAGVNVPSLPVFVKK